MGARRALATWAGLGAIGLLAVLSIVGAFLGSERAGAMFTSVPLTIYWVFLAGLVLVCLGRRGTRRSLGSALLHGGVVLILVGAMWGSVRGHSLARALLGRQRVPRGLVLVPRGASANEILDPRTLQPVDRLAWGLSLSLVELDVRYAPTDRPWLLTLAVPGASEAPDRPGLAVVVAWELNQRVQGGDTGFWIRVLRYLPRARLARQDGRLTGAEEDPAGTHVAMEVEADRADRRQRIWLTAPAEGEQGMVRLEELADENGPPELYLIRPMQDPEDWSCRVSRNSNGEPSRQETIAVNSPLHVWGYDLYLRTYDPVGRQYVVLEARSASGRFLVVIGLGLLAFGTLILCWVEPIWRRLKAARRHGH